MKAKVRGWTKYYSGKITRAHSDGTYDIKFDDGERKLGVKESEIEGGTGQGSDEDSGDDRGRRRQRQTGRYSDSDEDGRRNIPRSKKDEGSSDEGRFSRSTRRRHTAGRVSSKRGHAGELDVSAWEDMIRLSKHIAKKEGRRWKRVELDEVMEERYDEDKLDLLFESKWLRHTRRHFEDHLVSGEDKVSVGNLMDIFNAIRIRCSASDIRSWTSILGINSTSKVSFTSFLHAYATVFGGDLLTSKKSNFDVRRDPKGWRSERWAVSLGKGVLSSLEDAFDRHSVSRGVSGGGMSDDDDGRMLPARRLRSALWDMDRDVSRRQINEYMQDCGLRPEDSLSMAEFARCYYYLFCDDDRDDKHGNGSYHSKMFGVQKLGASQVLDEPMTISETAQMTFAHGWDGKTNQDYDLFMRRLCVGRSDAEVAALDLAKQVFQKLDKDENGEIACGELPQFFRTLKATSVLAQPEETTLLSGKKTSKKKSEESKKSDVGDAKRSVAALQPVKFTFTDTVITNSIQRYTEKTGRGPRDKVSFPEVLVEFGFVFEAVTAKSTVASAFSQLRLHATLDQVRGAGDFAVSAINKILENPYDSKFWRMKELSDTFHTNVGRFRGGSELVQAIGFSKERDVSSADIVYQFRWPKGGAPVQNSSSGSAHLEVATKLLRTRRAEVEEELKHLNGGRCSVAAAIQALFDQENDWEQVQDAMKLALQYVVNILSHPDDARRWRVRRVNPIFQRRIGKFGDAVANIVMSAVGFDESSVNTDVYVLDGTEERKTGVGNRFRFPSLSAGVASFLWRRKAELDIAVASIAEGKGNLFVAVNSSKSFKNPKAAKTTASKVKVGKAELRPKKIDAQPSKEPSMHPVSVAEQQSILSKYVSGKTAAQRAQLEMIKQAFDRFDLNRDGKITAAELRVVFRQSGQDASDRVIAQWIKEKDISLDGTVTFPEFVASFGALMQPETNADDFLQRDPKSGEYVLDATNVFAAAVQKEETSQHASHHDDMSKQNEIVNHSSKAVAASVGCLKLFNAPHTVQYVCEAVLARVKRLLNAPTDQKMWQIDASDQHFDNEIGKYRGGLQLMAAVGYVSLSDTSRFLSLRGSVGASKSGLPSSLLTSLRRATMELAQHLNGLQFLEIANVHAASAAMSMLGSQAFVKNSAAHSANDWRRLLETVMGYIDAILRNPHSGNHRRINTSSKAYKTVVETVAGGVEMVIALGFREDATGGMELPLDANMNEFRARSIEIKAALHAIMKFAAKEKVAKEHASKKVAHAKRSAPKNVTIKAEKKKDANTKMLKKTADSRESEAKVHVLQNEVSSLKQQIASMAVPREMDTVSRMNTAEKKKAESTAAKAGIVLNGGKSAKRGAENRRGGNKSGSKAGKSTEVTKPVKNANAVLSTHIPAGTATVPMDNAQAKGFKIGQKVRIGEDQFSEERFIIGFGSIILDSPLRYPHAAGEAIAIVKATAKELKLFAGRELRLYIRTRLIDVMIAKASGLGEQIVSSRRAQENFETRLLGKPLFCALPTLSYSLGNVHRARLASFSTSGKLIVGGHGKTLQCFCEGFSIGSLKAIFKSLDVDGDGTLDRNELVQAAMNTEVTQGSDLTKVVASAMLSSAAADADEDDDGVLTWDEFLGFFLPNTAVRRRDPPQGTWRQSEWAQSLSTEEIEEMWEVFSQELLSSSLTDEIPLSSAPGVCWELDNVQVNYDAVLAWAFEEGLINKEQDAPSITFPDFVRFRLESTREKTVLGNDKETCGMIFESKDDSSVMENTDRSSLTLNNAVSIFHRPPYSIVGGTRLNESSSSVFEMVAGGEGQKERLYVLHSDGHLKVWDTRSNCVEYEMQLLAPFGLNPNDKIYLKTAKAFGRELIVWATRAKACIMCIDNISACLAINTTPVDRAFVFFDTRSGRKVWRTQLDFTKTGEDGIGFMHTKSIDVDQGAVISVAAVRNPDVLVTALAESACISIFHATEGTLLAELKGHRGSAPPSLLYIHDLSTLVSGGGGQGDADLRVWALEGELFSHVERQELRTIVGKEEGDEILKELNKYVTAALSTEGGITWREGVLTSINSASNGLLVDVQYSNGDVENNVFPGRLSKTFHGPLQKGDLVRVRNERTKSAEITSIQKDDVGDNIFSLKFEDGRSEDGLSFTRLRDPITSAPFSTTARVKTGTKVDVTLPSLVSGLEQLLEMYDFDGNGVVSHLEFVSLVKYGLRMPLDGADAGLLCRRLDKDNDGNVDIEELGSALSACNYEDKPLQIQSSHTLRGHSGSVTAITYSNIQKLVVSAATDGTVRIWDAGAKLFRLSHPGLVPTVQSWPGYYTKLQAEWTKTSQPFMEALVLNLGDEACARHLSVLNLTLDPPPCLIVVDNQALERARDLDFSTKSTKPLDEASIASEKPDELLHRALQLESKTGCKGFVYLWDDGSMECVDAPRFIEGMVAQRELAYIEECDPLVRPGLRKIYRSRQNLMRVFYVVSHEYPSLNVFLEALLKSGNALRSHTSLARFCTRPHATIIPFYRSNDGPDQNLKLPKSVVNVKTVATHTMPKTAKFGTVTQILNDGKWYEIAYDHAQIESRVPRSRIQLTAAHDRRSAALGERAGGVVVGSRVIVMPGGGASTVASPSEEDADGSPAADLVGEIEVLAMLVKDQKGGCTLQCFGIGRAEIPVPAKQFDDELPQSLLDGVEREYKYHWAMSLAQYRARNPIVRNAIRMQIESEATLLSQVAAFLRRVSLDESVSDNLEQRRLLCEASLITAMRSPKRSVHAISACVIAVLRVVFSKVSSGRGSNVMFVNDVVHMIEQRCAMSRLQEAVIGPILPALRGAVNLHASDEGTVTVRNVLAAVEAKHARSMGMDECFALLKRLRHLHPPGMLAEQFISVAVTQDDDCADERLSVTPKRFAEAIRKMDPFEATRSDLAKLVMHLRSQRKEPPHPHNPGGNSNATNAASAALHRLADGKSGASPECDDRVPSKRKGVQGGLQRYAQAVAEERWSLSYSKFSVVLDGLKNQLQKGAATLLLSYSRDQSAPNPSQLFLLQGDDEEDSTRRAQESAFKQTFRYLPDPSQGAIMTRSRPGAKCYPAKTTDGRDVVCHVLPEDLLNKVQEDGVDTYQACVERELIMHSRLAGCSAVAHVYPRATMVTSEHAHNYDSIDPGFGPTGMQMVADGLKGHAPLNMVMEEHGHLGHPRGRLNIARLWVRNLARALKEMSLNDIVLRCLRPDNLFVSDDGSSVKIGSLSDAGLLGPVSENEMLIAGRIVAGPDLTLRGVPLTKDPYIPPEQFGASMAGANDVGPRTQAYIRSLISKAKRDFAGYGESSADALGVSSTNGKMPFGPWSPTAAYDMWSLGILLFTMVFGRSPPAYGESLQTRLRAQREYGNQKGEVSLDHYDFLSTLRLRDDRVHTVEHGELRLEHLPVVQDLVGCSTDKVRSGVVLSKAITGMSYGLMMAGPHAVRGGAFDSHAERLAKIADKFRAESRLRQQMMWRSGKSKGRGDTSGIMGLFKQMDKDGDGELSTSEVRKFITQDLELPLTQAEINAVVDALDSSGNGSIDLDEFKAFLRPRTNVDPCEWVLDVVAMCLTVDPSKRMTAAELLQHPFCTLTKEEEAAAMKEARAYMCTLDPAHLVDVKFTVPLRTTAATSATVLSEIIEQLSLYACTPVEHRHEDNDHINTSAVGLSLMTDPGHLPRKVRKLVTNEMARIGLLRSVVDSVLRMHAIMNGADFVGFESGAGFVPGDPRDPVGVRLVRRLVAVLARLVASMEGHCAMVLDAIVYLYMGGDGSSEARVDELVTPLVLSVFTESGTGNPKYPEVVDVIHANGKGSYYGEMLHLSVALNRCSANPGSRKSGLRKSGAIHICGLIHDRRLSICVDFRVWTRIGPLLDDTDADVRREALGAVVAAFTMAASGIVSLTSGDDSTSRSGALSEQDAALARQLGRGFSSRTVVSGIVRCLTRQHGAIDLKRAAVDCLRTMAFAGEEFLKAWGDCGTLVALAKNIDLKGGKRKTTEPVVDFFRGIQGMGLPGLQAAISQDSFVVAALRRKGIDVEEPPTLSDVGNEMDDLQTGAPTVSEMAAEVPRIWTVLQPFCSGINVVEERNEGVIKSVLVEMGKWLQTQWAATIRDGAENPLTLQRARVCTLVLRVYRRLARCGKVGIQILQLGNLPVQLAFMAKAMGEDLPYMAYLQHPLMPVQGLIAFVLADVLSGMRGSNDREDEVILASVASLGLGSRLTDAILSNTRLMQRAARDNCTEVHFINSYPTAVSGRQALLRSLLACGSKGKMDEQLAQSGFIETVMGHMLADAETYLSVDRYKVPLSFQPYNNTWALREEAIASLQILVEVTGYKCSPKSGHNPLREEMTRQLLRFNVVQSERERLWTFKVPHLQRTVVTVLRLLVDMGHARLDAAMKLINVPAEALQLRRQYPDRVLELDRVWKQWLQANYRRRAAGETTAPFDREVVETERVVERIAKTSENADNMMAENDENAANPWAKRQREDRIGRAAKRAGLWAKENRSVLGRNERGNGGMEAVSLGRAPERESLDSRMANMVRQENSANDGEPRAEPFVRKSRGDTTRVSHDSVNEWKERGGSKRGAGRGLTAVKKEEPMYRVMERLGDRVSELRDAYERQEAGREGVPPSEMMKLFWSAGVDDAADSVEQFFGQRTSGRNVGLDEFLRLYDSHEHAMVFGAPGARLASESEEDVSERPENVSDSPVQKKHATTRWAKSQKTGTLSSSLPDTALAQLKSVFESYDVNHDGVITFVDLRTAMSQREKTVTDGEIRRWIVEKDTTGDGTVNLDEFLQSYKHLAKPPATEDVSEVASVEVSEEDVSDVERDRRRRKRMARRKKTQRRDESKNDSDDSRRGRRRHPRRDSDESSESDDSRR